MSIAIANPEDYIRTGEYNPHNIRPWLIGNEYGPLAIAYASCEQDALDCAVDADLLKGLALDAEYVEELLEEYGDDAPIMWLGNAGEPFDSENAWMRSMPNYPPRIFQGMRDEEVRTVAFTPHIAR